MQHDALNPGIEGREDHFDSEFERSVCARLRERGLHVVTQEACGPFRIDLVARDAEGRELAVECDGSWKMDEFGYLRPEDYQRQDLIERAGWVVHRISGRRYLLDPAAEIDRTVEMLGLQPTRLELAILAGHEALTETALEPVGAVPAASREEAQAPVPEPEPPTPTQTVLGQPVDRIRRRLRGLVRWSLLGSRVQGSMFDRLLAIDERLDQEEELTEKDISALEFIHRIALQQGFNMEDETWS